MAVTQADIDSLNAAIASGVRSVTLGGQTVIYNTTESLIKARDDMVKQLHAQTATPRSAALRLLRWPGLRLMPTFSKHGKRMGRPPKAKPAEPALKNPTLTRAVQQVMARYDAAGRGRRLAGWNPPTSGPNTAMLGLQKIRDRSRDSVRNDWSSEAVVQKWATNLIGIGITPRFKRLSTERRKEVVDLFNDFVAASDADCVLNLYGQQTLAVRAWLDAGECFARRRPRFLDEDLPVPMQVQLLEADMCPLWDADTFDGLPEGHVIRSGIELNKRGRRIAYWFYKEHPGDQASGLVPNADQLVRVLARDVAHIFEPKRPGQLRGVPTMAPMLLRLRNGLDFEDATLERQRIANLVVGFISRGLPKIDPNDPNINPLTGTPYDVDLEPLGSADPLLPLKPGLVQELEDGQSVEWSNPPEAGTNYSDYMRTHHLGVASGAGLPYELMSGDLREVSDRTLRVAINDFRRFAEQRQWQIVIPQLCQKVIDWFAEAAVLVGKVSADEFDDVRRVEHAPHGWEYIHPVQDPQGKKLEVEAGFRSRSSVIGARGDDPDQVDEERQADIEREKKLGIYVDPMGAAPEDGDTDGIDDDEYSAPPNPAALALVRAQTELLRAKAARLRKGPSMSAQERQNHDLIQRALAVLEAGDEE